MALQPPPRIKEAAPLCTLRKYGETANQRTPLLDLGADMMYRASWGDAPAHSSAVWSKCRAPPGLRGFINAGFDPSTGDNIGRMILHLAARSDKLNAVEYLLRQKRVAISINARDNLGKTPLDYVRALMLYYGAFAVTNIPWRPGYQSGRQGRESFYPYYLWC